MDLSIVIVSYNVKDYLLACLKSIYANPPKVDFEVLVVDNVSKDGSVEAVRAAFPKATVIETGKNLGFGRGNNLGIERGTGRYVLILNPDTVIQGDALAEMVHFADAHPEAAVITCKLVNPDGTLQHSCFHFPSFAQAFYGFFPIVAMDSEANGRYPAETFDTVFEPEHILGAAILFRRQALDLLGGFDPGYFMYFEETDLCYRAKARGWLRLYDPNAAIIHYGGQSTQAIKEEMSVAFYDSQARYFRKNYGLIHFLILKLIVLIGILSWTLRSTRAVLRGRIDGALYKTRLKGYLRILTTTGAARGT